MDGLVIARFCVFLPLAFLSFIGNILLVAVKINRWYQHTLNSGDIFIMNLAICDFLKTLMFFALNLAPRISQTWKFGLHGCTYIFKSLFILFTITSITTVVLTVERYKLIAKPYKRRVKIKNGLILLSAMWILVVGLMNIPTIFRFRLYWQNAKSYCLSDAIENEAGLYIEIIYLGFIILFPSIAIPVLLLKVSKILLQNARKVLSDQPAESLQFKSRVKRNKRAVYILRSITIAYTTSYIPWIVLYIYEGVKPENYIKWVLSPQAVILFWFIAGSFCNTFLTYLTFSREFRKEMRGMFCRMQGCRKFSNINNQLKNTFDSPAKLVQTQT